MLAHAAPSPSYSLFGDASVTPNGNPGNAITVSNSSSPNYGGIDFSNTGVNTVSDLSTLSTEYDFTAGSCEKGSPRFAAEVTDGTHSGAIFFYVGPGPNYTNCPQNVWTPTGNLAASSSTVDTSQLPGGSFYDNYGAAQARYANYQVTDLFFVDDDYAATQTVLVDNTTVNGYTYDYGTPDTQAPFVAITNPTDGSTVQGTVDVRGTVTDANPNHYYLKITNDSTGQVVYSHTTYDNQSFTNQSLYSWDTTADADGNYTILLAARDDAGNRSANVYSHVTVNNTPDNMNQCKNDGWMTFTKPSFKNQGQCVSYVNHNNGIGADDTNARQ